jgi:hypothetical protein
MQIKKHTRIKARAENNAHAWLTVRWMSRHEFTLVATYQTKQATFCCKRCSLLCHFVINKLLLVTCDNFSISLGTDFSPNISSLRKQGRSYPEDGSSTLVTTNQCNNPDGCSPDLKILIIWLFIFKILAAVQLVRCIQQKFTHCHQCHFLKLYGGLPLHPLYIFVGWYSI